MTDATEPASEAVGWLLAMEPFGDSVAWYLVCDDGVSPITGPVAAEVTRGLGELQRLATELVPVRDAPTREDGLGGTWASPLTDPTRERSAAIALGNALLPRPLRDALLRVDQAAGATSHTLTIAVRGWLAHVPWDALALDSQGDVRVVERARVIGGLAPGLISQRARLAPPVPIDRPGLLVIDPGPASAAEEPDLPPLYGDTLPRELLAMKGDWLWARDDEGSTDALAAELTLADSEPLSRLIYVGHVHDAARNAPASAGLVLRRGFRKDVLSARTWLAAPERWPAPPRVAILGCGSDDSGPLEQSGLAVAAVNAGAHLVTGTRWPLPTDRAPGRGTTRLVVAVQEAFQTDDVVERLRRWAVARLMAWRESGHPDDSPLLWGSLVTYLTTPDPLTRKPLGTVGLG